MMSYVMAGVGLAGLFTVCGCAASGGRPMATDYSAIMKSVAGEPPILEHRRAGLDPELAIAKAEAGLGVRLPADYRRFLADFGGWCLIGEVACTVSEPFPGADRGLLPVSGFYGFVNSSGDAGQWVRRTGPPEDPPLDYLPIAWDPGGGLFCLGLRGKDYGKVFFWVVNDWVETGAEVMHPVAESFDAFMKSLQTVSFDD
jgi:hypothetical protein